MSRAIFSSLSLLDENFSFASNVCTISSMNLFLARIVELSLSVSLQTRSTFIALYLLKWRMMFTLYRSTHFLIWNLWSIPFFSWVICGCDLLGLALTVSWCSWQQYEKCAPVNISTQNVLWRDFVQTCAHPCSCDDDEQLKVNIKPF